jgi:hypothetical protein
LQTKWRLPRPGRVVGPTLELPFCKYICTLGEREEGFLQTIWRLPRPGGERPYPRAALVQTYSHTLGLK